MAAKKELKKEIRQVSEERDHLRDTLEIILANQAKSSIRDWLNIACWIVCFLLIVFKK
jgi:hypothetical protein